jgi:hypothetical protein
MRVHDLLALSARLAICTVFVAGCGSRPNDAPTNLYPFTVTNEIAGGEFRQVLQVTNGLKFYFTGSDVVMWFSQGAAISIGFDSETLAPVEILLKTPPSGDQPATSVLDINADGVPDMREIDSTGERQIFYRGEWYTRNKKGTNTLIRIGEKNVEMRFDGRRWILEEEN